MKSKAQFSERIKAGRKPNIPRKYLHLLERFLLRPIQTDEELTEAMAVVDELASRKKPLRPEEEQYFDVLCELIEDYENQAVLIPDVDAGEMLWHLMEARGVTQHKVALDTGIADSTLSAIRSGQRTLTRRHIEKLASYFGVEPGVFLPG